MSVIQFLKCHFKAAGAGRLVNMLLSVGPMHTLTFSLSLCYTAGHSEWMVKATRSKEPLAQDGDFKEGD